MVDAGIVTSTDRTKIILQCEGTTEILVLRKARGYFVCSLLKG